jgi:transposase
MPRYRSKRPTKARKEFLIQKPNGQLSPRVQQVGPEHFGIVANFYGQTILEPTNIEHRRGDIQAVIDCVRQAMRDHDLRDIIIAIERTGEYHRPIQLAFRAASFDTRLVHPLTSKQYRQPADPDNKTDDKDLAAIFRAASQGFGLQELSWPDLYRTVQLLRRHRRDLVDKTARLQCQIREVLHGVMPGYAELFCHLWDDSPLPMLLARQTTSADEVKRLGFAGLQQIAQQATIRYRTETLVKILAWADSAPPGHPLSPIWRPVLVTLDDDRLAKNKQILELERQLAHHLVTTPYIRLLMIPGINVVTAADLAGELGPLNLYANANAITGRAGLMPSRYQSDQVDRANGPLVRRGNRRLRAVLMQTADNLVQCNAYFRVRAQTWLRAGKDARWIRVKVAKALSRILFALVNGEGLFQHPCAQPRHYILEKLIKFYTEHGADPQLMYQDLLAAVEALPVKARAAEADPLRQELDKLAKRRGPQPLADIIPVVLARLGGTVVQSDLEGARP